MKQLLGEKKVSAVQYQMQKLLGEPLQRCAMQCTLFFACLLAAPSGTSHKAKPSIVTVGCRQNIVLLSYLFYDQQMHLKY